MAMDTRLIAAGEFKQRCLALMEEVAASGIELVITKHGTPICKLTPLSSHSDHPQFGWLKNSVTTHGDLTDSMDEQWEVNH
jgi:prevent-host-death family protein